MQERRNIIVTARACVVYDSKLLLVRGNGGIWHLPGGHLDAGENLKACAAREVYEETGYRPKIGDIIYCYEYDDEKWGTHKIENVFLATIDSLNSDNNWQDLGHDKSIEQQGWFCLDQIKNMDVGPRFLSSGKWLQPLEKT